MKDKEAYSIPEATERIPFKRSTLYAAIRSGDLVARKYGRKTIILATDLQAFLARLPTMKR